MVAEASSRQQRGKLDALGLYVDARQEREVMKSCDGVSLCLVTDSVTVTRTATRAPLSSELYLPIMTYAIINYIRCTLTGYLSKIPS
jgi:hypothetical protein